ncbi:uncharacterized protein VTP21DRAFT_5181 [Calcarisporiella thermophila]|uniref:uncharacterized protein n=1 Tax=Calcarisporiella thermophila TaxID=911321 RepID=UPI003744211D
MESNQSQDHFSNADLEQALVSSFRAAATSVTQLYKSATSLQRRAYQAGYEQCLQDLYAYLVSHPHIEAYRQHQGGSEGDVWHQSIPAGDVLAFARSKLSQLRDHSQPASTSPAPPSQQQHAGSTGRNNDVRPSAETAGLGFETAFTFVPPSPYQHQNPATLDALIPQGAEGGIGVVMSPDSLKRRLHMHPHEAAQHSASGLNFGLQLNGEYFEPPPKKGRLRRDE